MENAWLKISCRHGEVGSPIISSTTELILRFWILPVDWGCSSFTWPSTRVLALGAYEGKLGLGLNAPLWFP